MQITDSAATYPGAGKPLIWQFSDLRSTFSFPDRNPDEKEKKKKKKEKTRTLRLLRRARKIAGASFYIVGVIK